MRKEVLKEPIFAKEIAEIIKVSPSIEEMREQLRDYHENDIAQSFEFLNRAEPLSDAWCDCYNALQLELYHAELLEERR